MPAVGDAVAGPAAEEDLPRDHHREPVAGRQVEHRGLGARQRRRGGPGTVGAPSAFSRPRSGMYSPKGTRRTLS